MLSRFSTFKRDSMKTVNYLVKEFEMKKSVTAYEVALLKRVLSAPMMLSKYKFTDDIFKKLSIVRHKNHGMIILVDWSKPMSDVLINDSTVNESCMVLARKINILI